MLVFFPTLHFGSMRYHRPTEHVAHGPEVQRREEHKHGKDGKRHLQRHKCTLQWKSAHRHLVENQHSDGTASETTHRDPRLQVHPDHRAKGMKLTDLSLNLQ